MLLLVPSWRENHIEPLEEDPCFTPPEVRNSEGAKCKRFSSTNNLQLVFCLLFFDCKTLKFICLFTLKPLDDGVFLKRHAKLELDEKRRKR